MSDKQPGSAPVPFTIAIADDVLDDLHHRLRRMRWPLDRGQDDRHYGVNGAYLQELTQYWLDGYDWRAAERELNRYEHYRVTIDEVPVHFMRVAAKGPSPVPLIATHGWPWTFWHWSRTVDALADPAGRGGG